MEGVLVVGRHNAAIADTLQPRRYVDIATTFWLSMGYNFSCRPMIASDKLFDSSGGFSGTSYPMKI